MSLSPTADVSVRPSITDDAARLGDIQLAAWRASARLPEAVVDDADPAVFAQAWQEAIASPPSAKHRMLTACDGPQVVGFAAVVPVDEGTGEIIALEVDPQHVRQGHGSRLLAACTDILKQTGAYAVRTWAVRGDEDRINFLISAGFAPVGVLRRLDAAGVEVVEEVYSAQFE